MRYIYFSTAHIDKIDRGFIDIAKFFTRRKDAEERSRDRSADKGGFPYYAVWKVAIDKAWYNTPDLLAVYKNGESIDIKKFDEVL